MFTLLNFADPIWLAALVPFGVLTVWLLLVRQPRVDVPFIALWRSSENQPTGKSRQKIQRPPIALTCALLAILSALIGAGGPFVRRAVRGPITIIVDRSVCMAGAQLRDVQQAIAQEFGPGEVDLIELYAPRRTRDRSDWLEILSPVTGVDRRGELLAAVTDAERSIDHPIFVVSNQSLSLTRAVLAYPAAVRNVGVAQLSARTLPKPAVMVRLRNDSDFTQARLLVADAQRDVELPSRGQEKNYFFDLEELPQIISVELAVPDDNRADNRCWLVRAPSHPKIEVRASIPPAVQRMIDVFGKQRPPNDSSPRVVVTDNSKQLKVDEPALIFQPGTLQVDEPSRIADHPIARNVRTWRLVTRAADSDPPAGFTPIVSSHDSPIVAIREQPARQVWVGADLTEFARSQDFVVFLADVFDWLGAASATEEYVSEGVFDVPMNWVCLGNYTDPETTDAPSPGVYRDSDGTLHALNAIGIATNLPATQPTSDWKSALHESARHDSVTRGQLDLSREFLIAAMALAGLATLFWRGKTRGKGGSS